MKRFIFLLLIPLVFVSCTRAKYQEMQNEREHRRAAYEDARRKHDPRKMELTLTEKLLGTWQFLDMAVDEGDVSEEIAAFKYKLQATTRQDLRLDFFRDRNVFRRYQGQNGDTKVTGSFKISTQRYGDMPFPYLRVFRDTGIPFPEFISGMSHPRLGTGRSLSLKETPGNWLGISVTEDRLYLTLHGIMELTSNGWVQRGGIRCTFKRIE